jgi:diphthine synthase
MSGKKGRLAFVGLGLHDEHGITLRGLDELGRCDEAFAESYTAMLSDGAVDRLGRRAGKTVETMDRKVVEDGTRILEAAKSAHVVLLVPGDPMSATTHVDLRLRAEAAGIETAVVNGVSAMTAIPGLLGLQHYKFGRTTTLPFPQEGYSPTSPYEVVEENLARGLHTLVLLDIDAENSRYMTANEGLHLLLDMAGRVGRRAVDEDTVACVVARAGAPDCIVRAGAVREMLGADFGRPLHSLVVPGKLHFIEEEALQVLAGLTKRS